MVEGGDGGLLRVGNEAVDGLLSVDVGLVLEVAAEGVVDRLQQKAGDGNGEEEHDESGAAGERASSIRTAGLLPTQLPARAEAARQPGGKPGAGPVDEEQGDGRAGKLLGMWWRT